MMPTYIDPWAQSHQTKLDAQKRLDDLRRARLLRMSQANEKRRLEGEAKRQAKQTRQDVLGKEARAYAQQQSMAQQDFGYERALQGDKYGYLQLLADEESQRQLKRDQAQFGYESGLLGERAGYDVLAQEQEAETARLTAEQGFSYEQMLAADQAAYGERLLGQEAGYRGEETLSQALIDAGAREETREHEKGMISYEHGFKQRLADEGRQQFLEDADRMKEWELEKTDQAREWALEDARTTEGRSDRRLDRTEAFEIEKALWGEEMQREREEREQTKTLDALNKAFEFQGIILDTQETQAWTAGKLTEVREGIQAGQTRYTRRQKADMESLTDAMTQARSDHRFPPAQRMQKYNELARERLEIELAPEPVSLDEQRVELEKEFEASILGYSGFSDKKKEGIVRGADNVPQWMRNEPQPEPTKAGAPLADMERYDIMLKAYNTQQTKIEKIIERFIMSSDGFPSTAAIEEEVRKYVPNPLPEPRFPWLPPEPDVPQRLPPSYEGFSQDNLPQSPQQQVSPPSAPPGRPLQPLPAWTQEKYDSPANYQEAVQSIEKLIERVKHWRDRRSGGESRLNPDIYGENQEPGSFVANSGQMLEIAERQLKEAQEAEERTRDLPWATWYLEQARKNPERASDKDLQQAWEIFRASQ